MHRALVAGVDAMGLTMPVAPADRLPQLNIIQIPEGVSDGEVRKALLQRHNLEIGAGLSAFAGKAWRIGLMGQSATPSHVLKFLTALEDVLTLQGGKISHGVAVPAAISVFNELDIGA
jgi:alanine-glyoxylate transaminase/serine-glyoxylate transaminase/serine-pyruvate transaminase